jgi:glycerol-3-phosphate dehydrogenase
MSRSASKGLHSETLEMMSDVIPAALERAQPMAFISGPSFAKEILLQMPTGFSIASSGILFGLGS